MTLKPFASLICPLDKLPLKGDENCWVCASGHSFDIAKQGYINLLPAHKKQSREPGDSKAMVAARRNFLELGHYHIIAKTLADLIAQHSQNNRLSILDAGCGEGYYLQSIAELLPHSLQLVANDISKWAVQAAAKRNKNITWLVASNADLPIESESVDFVICLFGFPIYPEFYRVLKPSGKLIMIDPVPEHLYQLREQIYQDMRAKKVSEYHPPQGFKLISKSQVKHSFQLDRQEQIQQLALMTPHWFKAGTEGRERLQQLESLSITLAVELKLLEKIEA